MNNYSNSNIPVRKKRKWDQRSRTRMFELLISTIFIFSVNYSFAQKKLNVQGYVTNMQSSTFADVKSYWLNDNLLHNRINAFYYPTSSITASIQVRNRFIWGQTIQLDSAYADNVENDNGFFDLSRNFFNETSFLLNSSIDRFWIQITKEKLEVKIGRQRINWGQTMVWNPNDIFNNYSFFDFDYAERPGSDAVRIQYYPTSSSTLDISAKVNNNEKITAAALYRFNKWNYDIQFIGGILNEEDLVIGTGWSGAIKSVSFRGEGSYFHPTENLSDTSGLAIFSISADYSFKNSSMLMVEAMYGNFPKITSAGFLDFYSAPSSVKSLSFTRYNFLTQFTYPFSPLLNGSFALMYMPEVKGFYAGPTFAYSLKDNLEFSVIAQVFSGEFPEMITGIVKRQNFYMGFLRLKGSF